MSSEHSRRALQNLILSFKLHCHGSGENQFVVLFPFRCLQKCYFGTYKVQMDRLPRTHEDADKLIRLSELLQQAALTVKEEWAREDFSGVASNGASGEPNGHHAEGTARVLPSRKLWEAQRTIEAVSGALVELVSEPNQRIQQTLSQFLESRALFIAAERRIPDLLAEAGDDGLSIHALAEKTGIERRKLCKRYSSMHSLLKTTLTGHGLLSESVRG